MHIILKNITENKSVQNTIIYLKKIFFGVECYSLYRKGK